MKILALNSNYIPIRITSRFSAIGKFYTGMVEFIYIKDGKWQGYNWDEWWDMSRQDIWPEGTDFIESTTQRVALPAVMRYLQYEKIPKVTLRLTRKAIYERDQYKCYLCGKEFGEKKLSIDHIVPASRGGRNSWENLITCCKQCNFNKGDKTLTELKLKPKFNAYKPNLSNIAKLKASIGTMRPEWELFI